MIRPHRILWLALFVATLGLLPSEAAGQSGTVTDDAFVSNSPATQLLNANGQGISLVVAGSNATVGPVHVGLTKTYIKFQLQSSLPPDTAGAQVTKATLKLFVKQGSNPSGAIDIYAVTSPWSESTLNTSSPPALASTAFATGIPVSQAGSFLVVDLTRLVQDWMKGSANGGLDNEGIALVASTSATNVVFDSKESFVTSHEPRLEIVLVNSRGGTAVVGPQGPKGGTGPPGLMGPQGPPGPMPASVAITTIPNTFTGSQTINGNLILRGPGSAIQFADGTLQGTAANSIGAVTTTTSCNTFEFTSTSPIAPAGYTPLKQITAGDVWFTMAAMPTARIALAAVNSKGKIYAIGGDTGNSASSALSTLEVYDPSTNTWSKGADMPTSRGSLAAAAVSSTGKIYAIGGLSASGVLGTVEMYDPSTNTWTKVASMPTARAGLAAVTVNGKIYAIGGNINGGSRVNTVEGYDPSTNTWTTKAPMPTARAFLAAAVSSTGKIYAIGGITNQSTALGTVEVYDPATNTWSKTTPAGKALASMPTPRYLLAAAVDSAGKIYAIGGFGTQALATAEAYDAAANAWSSAAAMPTARSFLAAAVDGNGKIYAIGGTDTSDTIIYSTVEQHSGPVTIYTFIKE